MRISDWSSDVCSSDLALAADDPAGQAAVPLLHGEAGFEDPLAQVLHLVARLPPALAAAVLMRVDLLVGQRGLLAGDDVLRHVRPPDRQASTEQRATPRLLPPDR